MTKSTKRPAADGTTFTEADFERWVTEAEQGFPGWKFGKSVAGRPVNVGAQARPSRCAWTPTAEPNLTMSSRSATPRSPS